MKTTLLKKTCKAWLIIAFSLSCFTGFSASHVTFSLENCSNPTPNTVEYDLYIVNDGTAALKLASVSYGVLYSSAILNGGTPASNAYTFIAGTRDPALTGLNSYTETQTLASNQLRVTMVPQLDTGIAPILPISVPLRVGRFTFTNTTSWTTNSDPGFTLKMVPQAGFTQCSANVYIDGDTIPTSLHEEGITIGGFVNCSILLNHPTGIQGISNTEIINLYPNPFSSELNIRANDYQLSEISIYDITSRKLLQQTFTNSLLLSTEQFAKGIYMYEVKNKNTRIKKGMIVKQ